MIILVLFVRSLWLGGTAEAHPFRDGTLREARKAVGSGYQEIVLTGVNVGDYGSKIGSSLVALLRELVQVEGLRRIRVSSIEPNLITDELLSLWADNPVMCRHFHLPLQGGNDDILKAMRRRYLTALYSDRSRRSKLLFRRLP